MSAKWLLALVVVTSATAAHAEDAALPAWSLALTEETEPSDFAWEAPAYFQFKAGDDGDDSIAVRLNAEAARQFMIGDWTKGELGARVAWQRSTAASDRQNNLEIGGEFAIVQIGDLGAESVSKRVKLDSKLTAGWARTATYGDPASAPCVTAPANPACGTQHAESLRALLAVAPLHQDWENFRDTDGDGKGLAFSIQPKLELSHDRLIDGLRDATTGTKITGGYTAVGIGAAASIAPSFVDPAIRLQLTGLVRRRLAVASAREASVERTATLFQAKLTYFILNPPSAMEATSAWRAGVALVFTDGSDPLSGTPKQQTISLALTIGRF